MLSVENAKKRSEALLVALIGKSMAVKWWDSPNRAFDMKTPSEQWQEDYMVVYNYLIDHVSR